MHHRAAFATRHPERKLFELDIFGLQCRLGLFHASWICNALCGSRTKEECSKYHVEKPFGCGKY
jgi:hypothetical protein